MKLKITALLLAVFCMMLALMQTNCNPKNADEKTVKDVTPVPLPTNIVPGFHFPEDSAIIYKWISNNSFPGSYDSASIYKHAWGIWAGLTAQSGEVYGGDPLLVYQTWLGKSELKDLIEHDSLGCEGATRKFGISPFERPKQLEHGFAFSKRNFAMLAAIPGKSAPARENFANFWVTVSYNPGAACFATTNKIYKASVINTYYNAGGLGAIPVFPSNSITVKPAYLVFDDTDSLFKLPVWKTAPNPASASFNIFSNPDSMQYVYIDKNNKQPANKVAVPVNNTENNAALIKAATVNLSDFISLKIDKKMAEYMNMEQDSISQINAIAGQIAVLVGMHVTSKEISNWTWQSYYWTPTPKTPGLPSCDLAASLRPKEITGAAAHYACVTAYVMLTPNNAPNNTPGAGPIFGYNPYLEGSFGPGVFGFKNTYNASYQYGVQSNCMSCHALAIADTNSVVNVAAQYTTDQTIDLRGSYFKNQVSVDFAWSVQSAFIRDTIPYWDPQYGKKAMPPKMK